MLVIEKLKVFSRLENKGYTPIIDLETIKPDKLKLLNKMFGLEGRVISINSFMNIRLLNEYKIYAILARTRRSMVY